MGIKLQLEEIGPGVLWHSRVTIINNNLLCISKWLEEKTLDIHNANKCLWHCICKLCIFNHYMLYIF